MVGRRRDHQPAAMVFGTHAGKLRRPVERQMQLGDIALHADVADLADEAGVELARADQVEERRPRIGGRYDRARADLLARSEHDADGAAVLDDDPADRRAGADRNAGLFGSPAIAATTAPMPPTGMICAPGAPAISPVSR